MNPDQIREQQEASMRQMALNLAQQRVKPDASIDEILKEADKVIVWLMQGFKVAG